MFPNASFSIQGGGGKRHLSCSSLSISAPIMLLSKLEVLKRNFKHKKIIQLDLISSQVTCHQVSRKRKETGSSGYAQSHGSTAHPGPF